MPNRHPSLIALAVALSSVLPGAGLAASAAERHLSLPLGSADRPTTARINDLGPENDATARTAGVWDVTETVWDTPGAVPVVTEGLVAIRRMVGLMLEETLRSSVGPATPLRIDYLTFNRVEGRWEYVSMDTRAAVGIMTGQSWGRGDQSRIIIVFQPFAVPGPGPSVTGPMLRMRQEIVVTSSDRAVKNQYFTMADGSGVEWLAHRYAYVRRY